MHKAPASFHVAVSYVKRRNHSRLADGIRRDFRKERKKQHL